LHLVVLVVGAFAAQRCAGPEKLTYTLYEPVYLTPEELKASVKVKSPRDMEQPSGIYWRDGYLYIVEAFKGIHIIDNRNPGKPVPQCFLVVPGASQVAVAPGVLYVGAYGDLITFSVGNPGRPVEVNRQVDALPYQWQWPTMPPTRNTEKGRVRVIYPDDQKGYVSGWTTREIEEVQNGDSPSMPVAGFGPTLELTPPQEQFWAWCGTGFGLESRADVAAVAAPQSGASPGALAPSGGVGGSMSRFTLYNDWLYVVTDREIQSYSIANPTVPVSMSKVNVGWQIETVIPAMGHLFVGSASNMYILGLTNPAQPTVVSTFVHSRGCDPVFVDEERKVAYVTVRSGSPCPGTDNTLYSISVQSLNSPRLLAQFRMHNPHGLTFGNDRLYLCDGEAGLKVFDSSDPREVGNRLLTTDGSLKCSDAVLVGSTLMVIAEGGLHQYTVDPQSKTEPIRKVSQLNF
jgi:hypothetical protein